MVRPGDLGIATWNEMAAGYSVLELSTAVKPWLLRHLLRDRGVPDITYLDPDIQVFGSLAEVSDLLREHAVVVNPHLTAAMPRDGQRPSETDILISGSFNLGFAGFAGNADVHELLDWWSERLATDCLVAPERGYFVDQRWMDLVPGLVPTLFILRDPGYNVAYWNLAGRDVRRDGDRLTVNGRPLRFFHFSGYDPDHPDRLSKHQTRIDLAARPVLRELCDGYGAALDREGRLEWSARPYAWGALPDGTPLDAAARAAYRAGVESSALDGSSVFSEPGAGAFVRFLRGPPSTAVCAASVAILLRCTSPAGTCRTCSPTSTVPTGGASRGGLSCRPARFPRTCWARPAPGSPIGRRSTPPGISRA